MMVYGVAARVAVLPTICESPANRRCHSSALIITTGAPPGAIFLRTKAAPEHGSHAENPQETGRYANAFQNLRLGSAGKREVFLAGESSELR